MATLHGAELIHCLHLSCTSKHLPATLGSLSPLTTWRQRAPVFSTSSLDTPLPESVTPCGLKSVRLAQCPRLGREMPTQVSWGHGHLASGTSLHLSYQLS